jgi:acyl carrier protein
MKEVLEVIYNSIDEFNELNDTSIKKSTDTVLLGELDSLDFVSFIVSVEDGLKDIGIEKNLTSSKALSRANSPFKTVQTLIDYILE